MLYRQPIAIDCTALAARPSRRTVMKLGVAMALALTAREAAGTRQVRAAPLVTVAAPRIMHIEECYALVAVEVALSGFAPGSGYEVCGEIWEADEPDGEDDLCCALDAQTVPAVGHQPQTLNLTRQALATDLGLLRGRGAASDETSDPERISLFARVWVRDLASGNLLGPWQSPPLLAVPNPSLVWTPRESLGGRELVIPRGGPAFSRNDSIGLPLPPRSCAP